MGHSILLAEDEEHIAKIILFKLGKEGFEVTWKQDGEAALNEIRQSKPDLVLLDVMMPVMSGFEVLEAIKADPETKDIPTVMLTGMGQEEDTLKAFKIGAEDYITKPFRPAELVSRVKRILDLD